MKRNIKLPIMVLSSTLLFSGISPVLAEDATKDNYLEARVEQLEQRVSDLESQIAELLKLLDSSDQSEEASASTGSDEQTEAPEGLIGYDEAVEIGDWTTTMTGYEFSDTFDDPNDKWSGSYTVSAGSKYLKVGMTVTNNGTKSDSFIEQFFMSNLANGDIGAKVYYQDKYEFSTANFSSTMKNDLTSAYISPLETREGYVVFKVSDAVAESTDGSIVMELRCNNDTYKFQVR